VGDWVLAIGSPFGYNHSVSAGIVSAKHRRTQMNQPYQDFIQTDAAINPGNSGGALINLSGELVGVNSAIISESRTFEGIGLAIASNLAKWVTDRLQKDGRVRRGYLGVHLLDINQQLVDALRQDGIRSLDDLLADLGLDAPRGVFIADVPEGMPADRAGIRRGDVIVEFNGKKVAHTQQMFFCVAECEPGRTVKVKLLRDRKLRDVELELAERPAPGRKR
jgi:serine protease Do